ncbi:hypothetical protein [Granulicella sp. S156]|uniref:hypothetical protein n=1 Tax=Granulicella sp. S156 TaxID=1747224 RepID=UPI00131AF511|nr:hypothetical protein [Granulicella sp. S156]
MRAKKPILLYCADVNLLSATAFALRLHDYDVAAVRDAKEAIALAKGKDASLVCGVLIHARQGDPAGRLIHLLLESDARVPVLLVDRAGDLAPVRYADMVLYGHNTTMAHIFSALHLLCDRKTSPRPQSAA